MLGALGLLGCLDLAGVSCRIGRFRLARIIIIIHSPIDLLGPHDPFEQKLFDEVERDVLKITEDARAHVALPEHGSRYAARQAVL